MKLSLWVVVSILLLVVAGCAALDQVFLPHADGTPSDTVTAVDQFGKEIVASGVPWAAPVAGICTIFGLIAGVYGKMRGQQAAAVSDKNAQLIAVADAVVNAIEAISPVVIDAKGTTVGDILKPEVKKNLQDRDMYIVGKALITALKKIQDAPTKE